MKNKTWDEFWGEFLQVTFHQGHPDLWPARERKATWVKKHSEISTGSQVLDLGCGDGMIDVWLSRMGMEVTAVDRNSNVIKMAFGIDDTQKVKFISADLKEIDFPDQSFDVVIFIEATGLMSKEDELQIFKKIHGWLRPGGKFILDCPATVETKNSWTKEFPNGTARGVSGFNAETCIQDIQFYFKPHGGDEFGIYDPYDIGKGDVPGIMRYIYPKAEITERLEVLGFKVREIPHYYEKNYFGLLAAKN